MKPRTLQIHLQKELSRLYDAHEAAAIATRYVTDRFELSTAQLLLNDDVLLSAAEEEQTQRDVEQLLAQVPVQQVVGFEWFCGHRFRVTADKFYEQDRTHRRYCTRGWTFKSRCKKGLRSFFSNCRKNLKKRR